MKNRILRGLAVCLCLFMLLQEGSLNRVNASEIDAADHAACVSDAEDTAAVYNDGYIVTDSEEPALITEEADDLPSSYSSLGTTSLKKLGAASSYNISLDTLLTRFPGTRDQGDYGTCAAFATTALAEFSMISQGLADRSVDYSELQLAYFNMHPVADPLGGTEGDTVTYKSSTSWIRNGSNFDLYYRTLATWTGMIDESLVPYSNAAQAESLGLSDGYAYGNDRAKLTDVRIFNIKEDADQVKEAVMNNGGVAIGMHLDSRWLASDKQSYYCASTAAPNHAVVIVGWNDNYEGSGYVSDPGSPGAWLIRNSYTTNTGISIYSYFWLSYQDKGIDSAAYEMVFTDPDTYQYNYQYDGGILTTASGYEKSANVFRISGSGSSEYLKAVSFEVTGKAELSYNIKIYRNPDTDDPESGTLIPGGKLTGKTTAEGIYTVPLAAPVSLACGDTFSVVVTLTDSKGNSVGVDREYGESIGESSGKIWFVAKVSAASGQSYGYNGSAWKKITSSGRLGNLCIKAFTGTDGTAASAAETGGSGSSPASENYVEAVTGLTQTKAGTDYITLSWDRTEGAEGYVIERSATKSGTYKKVKVISDGSKLSWKDTSCKAGQVYYYRVRGTSGSGSSLIYGDYSEKLKAAARPVKVTKLTAKRSGNTITLSWKKLSSACDGYVVQRAAAKNGSYKTVKIISGSARNSYQDKTVKSGQKYWYRVIAYRKTAGTYWKGSASAAVGK